MNPTRVVLVDDHPLFRRGVAQLLSESQRFDMLEEFGNAEELLQNLERLDPELLLIDLQMPGTSGLSLLEQIKARCEDTCQCYHACKRAHASHPDARRARKTDILQRRRLRQVRLHGWL